MDEVLKISKGVINICIIDDDVHDLEITKTIIENIMKISNIAYTIDAATQVDFINKSYDIFILDVILNGYVTTNS